MEKKIIANDLLKVYEKVTEKGKAKKKVITVMAWGDPIEVGDKIGNEYPIQVMARFWKNGEYVSTKKNGFVSDKAKFISPNKNDVMKFSVCDVQQGDASILETPKEKRVFIDSGENKLFARYLAARYGGTTRDQRLPVDALVFTHGDKDHYGGLLEIEKTETHPNPRKQIFIHPKAILHNGLVKTTSEKPESAFGPTSVKNDKRYATRLVDDLASLNPNQLSPDYRQLQKVLVGWKNDRAIKSQGGILIQRLSDSTHTDAFKFLEDEDITVQILAPIERSASGKPALELFKNPLKTVPESQGQSLDANAKLSKAYSVSHTINGNSIVLLISYGNIRLLLAGDINQQSEKAILDKFSGKKGALRADILKAPHHGSSDFSTAFLNEIQPVISVISSGDEKERTEYIHPRATLVGALGKSSRVLQPLVLITELAAFFKYRGKAVPINSKGEPLKGQDFYAHERTSYGIVHFCFNKSRILVFTHSGKRDLKEAYVIKVDSKGKADFSLPRIA